MPMGKDEIRSLDDFEVAILIMIIVKEKFEEEINSIPLSIPTNLSYISKVYFVKS